MKQCILFVGILMLSTFCLANKVPSKLDQSLHSALDATYSVHSKLDSHDITMVYGGADISNKPTLVTRTTAA